MVLFSCFRAPSPTKTDPETQFDTVTPQGHGSRTPVFSRSVQHPVAIQESPTLDPVSAFRTSSVSAETETEIGAIRATHRALYMVIALSLLASPIIVRADETSNKAIEFSRL